MVRAHAQLPGKHCPAFYSCRWVVSAPGCCINGARQLLHSCVWLLPLNMLFWRFIHVAKCNSNLYLFIINNTPLYGYITVCGLLFILMSLFDNTECCHLHVAHLYSSWRTHAWEPWVRISDPVRSCWNCVTHLLQELYALPTDIYFRSYMLCPRQGHAGPAMSQTGRDSCFKCCSGIGRWTQSHWITPAVSVSWDQGVWT